ncbi:MAG: RcpC/CpaB family pilus assembly protein, partial [Actinomycetes bacterium]
HRRLLSAGLLAGSVALALHALSPPSAATVPVLAAGHDLAGGTTVREGDLAVLRVAADAVPDGAMRPTDETVGRTLVGPVRAGEVVTDVRLLGPSHVAGLGEGTVATPVRIADPGSVSLLRPGDVVDVLAAAAPDGSGDATGEARLVAAAVRVVTLPAERESGLGGDFGEGALVVLATSSQTAARLASAAVTDRLSVTIRGG